MLNKLNINWRDVAVISILLLASIFSTGFIVLRRVRMGEWTYYFLVWNLFLAWIPLGTAFLLRLMRRPPLLLLVAGGLLWLLFLPNAPYIMTDLIHFRRSRSAVWLDWSMFLSFALTGLFAGFASLSWMQSIFRERWGQLTSWILVMLALGASGFGVYIGRFLRWNSWDIVTRPQDLLYNIYQQLFSPETFVHTWSLSLIFGILFTFCYSMMHLLSHTDAPSSPHPTTSYGD